MYGIEGECLASMVSGRGDVCPGMSTQGGCLHGGVSPGGVSFQGVSRQGDFCLGVSALQTSHEMVTAAVGKHPSGVHSCLIYFLPKTSTPPPPLKTLKLLKVGCCVREWLCFVCVCRGPNILQSH